MICIEYPEITFSCLISYLFNDSFIKCIFSWIDPFHNLSFAEHHHHSKAILDMGFYIIRIRKGKENICSQSTQEKKIYQENKRYQDMENNNIEGK